MDEKQFAIALSVCIKHVYAHTVPANLAQAY